MSLSTVGTHYIKSLGLYRFIRVSGGLINGGKRLHPGGGISDMTKDISELAARIFISEAN